MLPRVKIKHMFILLFIVLPFVLLLRASYRSARVTLVATGQDGVSTFRNLLPSWRKVTINQVYVRHPPWTESLPTIYIITPTYYRLMQKAELTRMSNTLLHVANLHWIVVEDSDRKSSMVRCLLENTGLNYTHLNVHIAKKLNSKGSLQRNAGLKWLRETFGVNDSHHGVVYFGDDDNTYSLELFDEVNNKVQTTDIQMRYTKKVSVWPVAFVGAMRFESVKVNASGKVYGWDVKYAANRRFAIDMAGFAVNLQLLLSKPNVYFRLKGIPSGHQESNFLQDLVTLNELEPKADNCTKVLVWHTRSASPPLYRGYGDPHVET